MIGEKKKKLLIRILNETKDFIDEFLTDDLENNIDYEDPDLQDMLYWLVIMLRDIMVISKKLRERHDDDFIRVEGFVSLKLHILLEDIEKLWPEKSKQ